MITVVWSKLEDKVVACTSEQPVPSDYYSTYGNDWDMLMYRQTGSSNRSWILYNHCSNNWFSVSEDSVPTFIRMQAMLLR